MSFGIRTKLFSVSLALIFLVGGIGGIYLERELRGLLERQIEEELQRHAQAGVVMLRHIPHDIDEVDDVADQIGAACNCRITVIDHDGRVLGDSELTRAEVRAVDNHGDRPEVRAAIADGRGMSRRYSSTLDTKMLYVAVDRGEAGTIRASRPLSEVDEVVARLRVLLAIAAVVGLGIALIMSAVAYKLISNALRILAEERARSDAVLEGMNEAVLALDGEGRITVINQAASELLRLPPSGLGRRVEDLIDVEELSDLAVPDLDGPATAEFELKAPKRRQVLAHATPLGASPGVVIVMVDVTDMRRLERMRKDFVANVSHELRTPVSVIRANAETLLDGALGEPAVAQQFLEAMVRNSERLSRILDDLLDLSRIEAGKYGFEFEELRAKDAVAKAMDAVDRAASAKRISIDGDVDPTLAVYADAKGLDQVLINLLDNAVKYTPEGGAVVVRALKTGDKVRIEVKDNGPGVLPKHRARIFERFYRVDKGRSREIGGTGLGLAIVKHLVDSMAGSIGLEPAEPHGSIFWVELPATGPGAQLGLGV